MRKIHGADTDFSVQTRGAFASSEHPRRASTQGLGEKRRETTHLAALDGLRGIAAFSVVYFHYCSIAGTAPLLPGAGLAVDFFFALSGYVLGHAYADRLKDPAYFTPFVAQRVVRLYPLALIGCLLGVVVHFLASEAMTSMDVINVAFGVLLLPTPFNPGAGAFPYNPPLWSLACEMTVNIALALFYVRLSNRVLIAIAVVSATIYIPCHIHVDGPPMIGRDPIGLIGVMVRTTGPFFLGVVLQRFNAGKRLIDRGALLFAACCGALITVFAADPHGIAGAIFTSAANILVFPIVILVASRLAMNSDLVAWLGKISFPVYILHDPLLRLANFLGVLSIASVLGVVAISWVVGERVDVPLRRAIRRALPI
jgi:peptidoglycan/LPS O-acetylase OafA/YrhL